MARNSPNSVFELYDPTSGDDRLDICGLWEVKPASTTRSTGLAFSTSSTNLNQDAFIWRTKLPENRLLAAESLIDGEAKLENYVNSLKITTLYIDRLSADELRQLMLKTQATRAGIDFGLVQDISAGWSSISPQFLNFVNRIQRLLGHYASIETFIGKKLIARTLVTWAGDSETLWQTSRTKEETELHHRNVALSLRSKDAWVQTFVVVVQGTLKLAFLLTSGATIFALPAVWRLVQDMVAQAETLRSILSEQT